MKNILFLFLFGVSLLQAQPKHDYNWLFGYGSENGTRINFNENPLSVQFEERDMNIYLSNASISDAEGNLLFYTNGCYIADMTNQMMENGDSINPGAPHDNNCEYGYTMPQGLFILPKPNDDKTYYLFHKASVYQTEPVLEILNTKLYYSKIDMTGNDGLGVVVEKNNPIMEDTLTYGQLTAVKHSNNEDWWIMVNEYLTDRYYTFLFTEFGVQDTIEQRIGAFGVREGEGGGQAVFSPDGTKYVRYTPADDIFLFDFDRATGLLSNFLHIPIEDDAFVGGVAISPNSRYLYISSQFFIYQFDLEAEDIADSKIVVAEYDGFLSPFPSTFYQMQLAPDCRIYVNSGNGIDVLHTINYPDNPGLACGVAQHSVQLPTNHQASMPNFPNYRLGVGPVCDTSFVFTTNISQVEDLELSSIQVYPNPAGEVVQIKVNLPSGKKGHWLLYNSLGELVVTKFLDGLQQLNSVSIERLSNGIYFYKLEVDGSILGSGKLVVEK